ncbi:hypothetical protein ACFXKR_34895 [Streptomyces violascens]|uniref:hypothetical protein n=1 Tax=Streptomyces violascens TaxID=67381 RepID=UPI00367DD3F1
MASEHVVKQGYTVLLERRRTGRVTSWTAERDDGDKDGHSGGQSPGGKSALDGPRHRDLLAVVTYADG